MNPAIVVKVVVVCLAGILATLHRGLFAWLGAKHDSQRLVNALTVRIVLSVGLFVFLLIAWRLGWIHPHGFGR